MYAMDLMPSFFFSRKEKAETNASESTNKTEVDQEMADTINEESAAESAAAAAAPAEVDQDGEENNDQEEEEDSDDVRHAVCATTRERFINRKGIRI